jgi:molecular chaperone GrpE
MKGNPLNELGRLGQSSVITSNDAGDISGLPFDAAQFVADPSAYAEGSAPEAPSLEQRLAALEAEKADLDNYKKRIRNEMSEHETGTREAILSDFLEVADNLERAIASWERGGERNVKSIRDGVEMVLRLLRSKLARHSVTAIEAKGQPFDPRLHHAISQMSSNEVAPGAVLHEVQKGYRAGERLLRPATVVVASAPPVPQSDIGRPDQERTASGSAASTGRGHRRHW